MLYNKNGDIMIRYDKKFNKEINRIVRNYNQKITRIEKYVDSFNYHIPSKTTVKALKQNVYTRTELRRKLNELKRYSQRGIEESIQLPSGNIISKYEYQNLKREAKRVKQNVSREIKFLETEKPTNYGKRQYTTFAQMGDSYYLNMVAKRENLQKQIDILTGEEYENYKKFVYKTGRSLEYQTSLFRENYKDMLFELAYYTKYDEEKIKLLEKKLDKLKNKDFYKLFRTENGIKAITEYYLLVTGKKMKRVAPEIIKDDVWQNYDNLIENIDNIIALL